MTVQREPGDRMRLEAWLGGRVADAAHLGRVGEVIADLAFFVAGDGEMDGDRDGRRFSRLSPRVVRSVTDSFDALQVGWFVCGSVAPAPWLSRNLTVVGFTPPGAGLAEGAPVYEVTFSVPLGGDEGDLSAFVRQFRAVAEGLGALQGQVHPYRFATVGLAQHPPLVKELAQRGSDPPLCRFGGNALARWLRTPAWGLWLTEAHLSALDGAEVVATQAPAHRVEVSPAGCLLQLTPDPLDPDLEEHLVNLARYLTPLHPDVEAVVAADLDAADAEPLVVAGSAPAAVVEDIEYLDPGGFDLGVDDTISVSVAEVPGPDPLGRARTVLDRWYLKGARDEAFGPGFHSLQDLPFPPPDTLLVEVDFGSSDKQAAIRSLADDLRAEIGDRVVINVGPIGWADQPDP